MIVYDNIVYVEVFHMNSVLRLRAKLIIAFFYKLQFQLILLNFALF